MEQSPGIASQHQYAALPTLLVYLIAFYASWSCYILLVTPHLGHGPLFLILENLAKLSVVTSSLFLLIHFPRWIRDGQLMSPSIIGAILYVFAFSCLQGYILKKSGSLWSCFLAHSIGNLTSFALGSAAFAGVALILA
jgi:hypothetical protein